LARRLAAIKAAHRAAEQPVPVGSVLDHVWAGIRRVHGRAPNAKAAVSVEQLSAAVEQLPSTSAGIRDRALLLLGFAGALRRSELVSLEIGRSWGANRIQFVAQGLEVVLQRSKADQEGAGVTIGVPFGRSLSTCAVHAVRCWLNEACIEEGPVFRRIDRWGNISNKRLTDQVVAAVVKAAARRIGLDPRRLSGHSLRAGLATAAAAGNAPAQVIMEHMRHAQFETTARYIREAERFKRNAAQYAGV
jgi:integrase